MWARIANPRYRGLATNGLGNTAVKATRTVAGKQFAESGASAVSESVAQGVVGAGGKVAEKIADDKQK